MCFDLTVSFPLFYNTGLPNAYYNSSFVDYILIFFVVIIYSFINIKII